MRLKELEHHVAKLQVPVRKFGPLCFTPSSTSATNVAVTRSGRVEYQPASFLEMSQTEPLIKYCTRRSMHWLPQPPCVYLAKLSEKIVIFPQNWYSCILDTVIQVWYVAEMKLYEAIVVSLNGSEQFYTPGVLAPWIPSINQLSISHWVVRPARDRAKMQWLSNSARDVDTVHAKEGKLQRKRRSTPRGTEQGQPHEKTWISLEKWAQDAGMRREPMQKEGWGQSQGANYSE